MVLMSELTEAKTSSFQEASERQMWIDAMVEEYSSIMKKSVWEVVLFPERKHVVALYWFTILSTLLMVVWISSKLNLWLRGFLRRRALTMMRPSPQ